MNAWRRSAIIAALCLSGCAGRRCATAEEIPSKVSDEYAIPKALGVTPFTPTSSGDAAASTLRQGTEELTWTFDQTAFGRIDVVVVLPDRLPSERFPVLIALHGRGEAMK